MKITIDPFDKKSIAAAERMLRQYKKDFLEKEAEFIRRLKEIGVSVATTGFATADYDGVNDVLIAETQNGNRAAVIAYGKTVGFIEFGTGIRNPEWVDDNNVSGNPYKPPKHGTYGKGKGANKKGWWFSTSPGSAQHTYGNQPAEAMLEARNSMVEQVVQIAREVWR
jgi:hypothetical protein